MKTSRSTSRPRRLARHGKSGTWIGLCAVILLLGAGAWFGRELGWWTSGPAKAERSDKNAVIARAPAEGRMAEAARATQASSTTPAPTPRLTEGGSDSIVPAGAPFAVPKFGKEFDDAIERGNFRDAEDVLARIGGASDAERRLSTAMETACSRITARFEEIRAASGERAARVYVGRQIHDFPDHADARARLQALIAAPESQPAEGTPSQTGSPTESRPETQSTAPETAQIDVDLAATKDEAAHVLETGDLKAALSVLREVATAAEGRNQRAVLLDAQRLIRQGEAELRLRSAIIDRVGRKVTGERLIPHLPGERGMILAANEDAITFAGTQGQVTLKWRVLPVHSLSAIIPLLELSPQEMTDAAATLYRASHGTEADALLAKAFQSGAADIKTTIDQTLADARAMSVPAEGFRFIDEHWLSPQEFARHEIARDIAQSTKELAGPDPAARRAAFLRMMKLGDAAKSPLNRALLLRRAEIREEIQKAPVHAKLTEVAARRQDLDDARAHALELIEDEVKYPYPYRPPEASAETFKIFETAQREVDIRVAKIRGIWNEKIAVALPKGFREKVALLAEVDGFLAELGAAPAAPEPGWLMYLPPADEVTLQTIATSEPDRHRIDESAVTMQTNATRATKSTRAELDEAKITNDYRVMFGRAAVLVHDLLTTAAHGHCEDMVRLGFFAHQSPVPGKATPTDRVALTGMKALGVSENIAEAAGAMGAHNGWCHSSGHHRNLLAAGWKLLGVGNSGNHWCQNFSAGERKPLEPEEGGGGEEK